MTETGELATIVQRAEASMTTGRRRVRRIRLRPGVLAASSASAPSSRAAVAFIARSLASHSASGGDISCATPLSCQPAFSPHKRWPR